MFIEFDLAGAEWVVVAYLSDDANMLRVVERMADGHSPHVATGEFMSRAPAWLIEKEHKALGSMTDSDTIKAMRKQHVPELLDGDFWLPRSMTIRQAGKKGNHGLNYDLRYRKFALINEMPENEAATIVDLYHNDAYPGIRKKFHADIKTELRKNDRTLVNLLGRKARLLDQPGPDLWDKAYSFKPQSTVADIVIMTMDMIYQDLQPVAWPMRMKANVHDSLMFWYPVEPWDRFIAFASLVHHYLSPTLSVGNKQFVLGVDVKYGPNWGEMKSLDLAKEVAEQGRSGRYDIVPLVRPTVELSEWLPEDLIVVGA